MLRGIGDKTVKDFLNQMHTLARVSELKGLRLVSSEAFAVESVDGFLFIDCPKPNDLFFASAQRTQKPLFLMVWESDLINNENHNKEMQEIFDIIFTYNDLIVDNKKIFKAAYNFDFSERQIYRGDSFNRDLLCLISSNNYINRPGELYSLRRKLVDWYSENFPECFHLYGRGWGKIIPPRNFFDKLYNKFPILHPLVSKYNKCYRGEVDSKITVGLNYKFQICFENMSSPVGYVSEKLFHAIFSDSVPIYLGAENIKKLVPYECFIDFREFESFSGLHEFLIKMDRYTYLKYLDNAKEFLSSTASEVFNTDYFSNSVSDILIKRLSTTRAIER